MALSRLVKGQKGVGRRKLTLYHPAAAACASEKRPMESILLAGIVGGAPIAVLRQCIEQQKTPEGD